MNEPSTLLNVSCQEEVPLHALMRQVHQRSCDAFLPRVVRGSWPPQQCTFDSIRDNLTAGILSRLRTLEWQLLRALGGNVPFAWARYALSTCIVKADFHHLLLTVISDSNAPDELKLAFLPQNCITTKPDQRLLIMLFKRIKHQ